MNIRSGGRRALADLARSVMVAFLVASAVSTASARGATEEPSGTVRWEELTSKAEAPYQGDGLELSATEAGAELRCVFQRLEGQVTDGGLWLVSTVNTGGDRFQVVARSVGREGQSSEPALPLTGTVAVVDRTARFVRPGLVEEYSVSMEGVRQDLLVLDRPAGGGALRVELEVTGAMAEPAPCGARLALASSAREIAYHRLRVTDATGRALEGRMEVVSANRLAVVVDDTDATYPVRVDPTFTDADWVSMGESHGVNNMVMAMAVDGSGNVYVGGFFVVAGAVPANSIAKWDGSAWSTLGSGVNDVVNALVVSGTDLYVGGRFTTAGGSSANYVAKWNGTTWSTFGTGVGGWVTSLAVSGTDLYVGGYFTTAGGSPANSIAKWDGSAWSTLGSGVNDVVNALAVSGTDLYVGGRFTTAGGGAANRIARWNGSAWSALGSGTDSEVLALAVSGANLYVGGTFSSAGGGFVGNVARWNGSAWSAMGTGTSAAVYALAVSGTDVYAGGYFTFAGGSSANYVAKWNGSAWSALGSGTDKAVFALAVFGANLYVGGDFTTAGGSAASHVASWTGSAWSRLGSQSFPGLNSQVFAVAVSGTSVYVGGDFTTAGNVSARYVAKWDGSAWSALGTGLNGYVHALAVSGTDLYVGGQFTTAGGISAERVAKWNGTTWSALGTGVGALNEGVSALAVSGTELYAGGGFSVAGGGSANNIAKWDGSTWSALGSGVNAQVNALLVSGTNLYVGGMFTTAGGGSANRIAVWDGSAWSTLGSGMNGSVRSLAMFGGDLYAGGNFSTAGGASASYIAKWDGSAWSPLGTGFNFQVYSLAATTFDLYVGGFFTTAGGVNASRIAGWDGSAWFALGSGVNGSVYALAVHDVRLYAGGAFTVAGGKASVYAATGLLYEDFPIVVSVADVPNDQGGRVRLRFARSRLDSPYEVSFPVTGYQVYHRIDNAALTSRVGEEHARSAPGPAAPLGFDRQFFVSDGAAVAGALPPGVWEAVSWVGATQSDAYTALVPTTADSTDSGIAWSVYAVTSHTTTPSTWYASPPDSGYSVDNLFPNVPTGFAVSFQTGSGSHLVWDDPVDDDFRYFKVYRSTDPDFTPEPSNLVHSTTATSWIDADYTGGNSVYYKLAAVDFSGNESAPTSTGIVLGIEGSSPPVRFALRTIAPNPARPGTVVTYDVPAEGGAVSLQLFDIGGRAVRRLVDAHRPPGRWSVAWDGRDDLGRTAPAGMYLVRMQAADFVQVRKLVVTR